MKRTVAVLVLLSALTSACGDPDAGPADSATGGDAGTVDSGTADSGTVDSGTAEEDSGTTDDAGATEDGGTSPLVAECEARAMLLGASCEGSDPRPCLWEGYRALCALGQTQLLLDSMECLSDSECRTFSDPNDGAECLGTTHAAGQSAAARAAITEICESCGGSGCDAVVSTLELVPYLSDADIALLEDCRGTACSTDALIAACASSVPGLAALASCD